MEDDPKQESVKDTPEKDSFEKRYKDLQAHSTKVEQENLTLKDQSTKDKELFETIQPYINWDAVNGTPQKTEDDDGLVDKKTLNAQIKTIQDQMQRDRHTQDFRTKYPDMVEYEDLVGVYLQKTDPRRSMVERMEKAVENTKALLKTERAKGVEQTSKKEKEDVAKEAEVSGLSDSKVSVSEKENTDGETFDDYIASRKDYSAKVQGIRS